MKVVVTGATGLVGTRVVRRLGDAACAWTRADVDLESASDLSARLGGVDAVVHLAARVPSDHRDPREAERCFAVNALGTLRLLEACASAGVPRFVHFSSGNVYRADGAGEVDELAPTYPAARATYYLASKLCGELYAAHFAATGRLSVAILRPSAIYGAGAKGGGVVAKFADQLRRGEVVTVTDGGRYASDLVHVDDVVEATLAVVERRAEGTFNVGSGVATSTLDLARGLAELCGRGDEAICVEPATGAGGVGFSALSIARARRELAYEPTPVREGLRRYLAETSRS